MRSRVGQRLEDALELFEVTEVAETVGASPDQATAVAVDE